MSKSTKSAQPGPVASKEILRTPVEKVPDPHAKSDNAGNAPYQPEPSTPARQLPAMFPAPSMMQYPASPMMQQPVQQPNELIAIMQMFKEMMLNQQQQQQQQHVMQQQLFQGMQNGFSMLSEQFAPQRTDTSIATTSNFDSDAPINHLTFSDTPTTPPADISSAVDAKVASDDSPSDESDSSSSSDSSDSDTSSGDEPVVKTPEKKKNAKEKEVPTTLVKQLLERNLFDNTKKKKHKKRHHRKETLYAHAPFKFEPLDINTLTVAAVIQRRKDIAQHEQTYPGQVVRWSETITEDVKLDLLQKHTKSNKEIDIKDFNKISESNVYKCLIAKAGPSSKKEFIEALTSFECDKRLSKEPCNIFTFSKNIQTLLLSHISRFKALLKTLRECNVLYCPMTWNTQKNPAGGARYDKKSLVYIFLNTFPDEIGHQLYDMCEIQTRGTFEAFTEELTEKIRHFADKADDIKPLTVFLSEVSKVKRGTDKSTPRRLNALESDTEPSDDEQWYCALVGSTPNFPNGCYKMVLKGTCPDGKTCKYSHSMEDLNKTCDYLKVQTQTKLADLNQRKFMNRDRPAPAMNKDRSPTVQKTPLHHRSLDVDSPPERKVHIVDREPTFHDPYDSEMDPQDSASS